jgi:uncharacterized protein (TIGR02117 family)
VSPALSHFLACRVCRGVLLCLLLLAPPGHASTEWECAPPQPSCRSVFIVHSAWHAAIVLRKSDIASDIVPELVDFPSAQFIEFSWGDKDYFPNPDAGVFAGLKAAFWSSGSVVHAVGLSGDWQAFYAGAEIIELRLMPAAYGRLLDFVSKTFSRPAPGYRAQAYPGLFAHSYFYPATLRFSLLRTCNGWVAEALESAGLPIAPSYVITAGQLAEQIGKLNQPR